MVCMQNEEGLNATMWNLQSLNPYLRRGSFIIVGSQSNRCSPVMERAVAEATTGKLGMARQAEAEARATARV
jgi:hypothetical protein